MNSKELIRMLEEDGWRHVHTTGSHHHFKHPTKPNLLTVPHPKKDLPIGTVHSILKKPDSNESDFFTKNTVNLFFAHLNKNFLNQFNSSNSHFYIISVKFNYITFEKH